MTASCRRRRAQPGPSASGGTSIDRYSGTTWQIGEGNTMAWQEDRDGVAASAPSAVRIDAVTFVFVRGVEGGLWFNQRPNPAIAFRGWTPAPGDGVLTSAPAVVAIGRD